MNLNVPQVTAELWRLYGRDHRLLHLYLVIQKHLTSLPTASGANEHSEGDLGATAVKEDLQSCWSILCSRLKRNNLRSEDLAPQQGRRDILLREVPSSQTARDIFSSEDPTRARTSKWTKARAIFLYSICGCFFRKNKRKQKKLEGKFYDFLYIFTFTKSVNNK